MRTEPQPITNVWNGVVRILRDVLPSEDLALHRTNGMRDDFSDFFRVKIGRLRLIYAVSSAQKVVIVLYVGQRKEGDKHDVYEDFGRKLRAGMFDDQLVDIGLAPRKPRGR